MEHDVNAYEILGRKQIELDHLNSEYDRLLTVLHLVSVGEIDRNRVSVDVEKRRWSVLSMEPLAATESHDLPVNFKIAEAN